MKTPIIKRSVLREEIKSYLIDAIVKGTYKTGERLVETQIARDLGISQAPVREAFRDLEQIGILKTVPYKGAYVNGYSTQDLRNAYDVRAELEGLAIKIAVPQITDEQINELENIYTQMQTVTDLKEQVQLDVQFHEYIVKASHNSILERAWKSVSVAHWTYYGIYNFDELDLIERHESIIQAFRERDAQKATDIIKKHFLELKDQLE
ncbi:MAG: hypothetical protein APF84_10950 [Gracilibacter sp. BRH_c7a]|nr:MAG: hypothetical protein APF84_10950 [Gracilibacter sp. BRH_c7a]